MKRLAVVLAVCLGLAACATIPTEGAVHAGDSDVVQPEPVGPILTGPEPNASPRSIVQGFLIAAAGGAVSGFDVARKFLTSDASLEWDPLEQITVFDSRPVVPSFNDETGTFTYTVPVAAKVDASGVMTAGASDVKPDFVFEVELDELGQYRITSLDDGIVMSAANFARFFRPVTLYFATPDGATVVPDLRWFPDNDQIATATARELVAGPSAWLADAVITGFPPGSALDVDAVVVGEGAAQVALAPGSAGNPTQRSLAQEQMRLTLTQLPTVQEVVTTVGGLPIGGDDSVALSPAELPGEVAALVVDGRLGLWDGTTASVTAPQVGVVPAGISGIALAYDGHTVTFAVGGDVAITDVLSETATMVPADDEVLDLSPEVLPYTVVMEGTSLVPPSFDARGWLWSTEAASAGVILAAMPGGDAVSLEAPWLAGSSVQAVAASRDGARLAILSRSTGEQMLDVVAIARDDDGRPVALGDPLAFGLTVSQAIDLAWVDDTSLVTLGQGSGEITLAEVGGWTSDVTSSAGATAVTARNGVRTLLAVAADGVLLVRSGNDWNSRLAGVTDVAYSG